MSVLAAIRDKMSALHPKEQELAAYLLAQPAEAARLTITELAARTGSSPATVSRFCRSFHFRSFPDFKQRLAAELAGQTGPAQYQDIVAGNPLADIVSAITSNHVRSLTDTTGLLDLGQLRQAIALLHGASRIDLYGSATSGIVAQDFWSKLVRIGKAATAYADPHMAITSASSLTERDVAVGISYSGETAETVNALRCAAEHGAATIAITGFGVSALASLAEVKLFASSSEAGMRRGDMASRIALLHVVDILFMGLVSEHFDEYVPLLERSYQSVRRYTGKEGRNE